MSRYVIRVFGYDNDPTEPGECQIAEITSFNLEHLEADLDRLPERFPFDEVTRAELVEETALRSVRFDAEDWPAPLTRPPAPYRPATPVVDDTDEPF